MIKLAINGVKQVGKDFTYEQISERLLQHGNRIMRIGLADFLKKTSILETFPDWKYNSFLREDFALAQKSFPELLEDLELTATDYDYLSETQKLALIEIFKSRESQGFNTRFALQGFGDYHKEKTQNPFIFSDLLLSEINKPQYEENYDIIVNTDTRFITELINFLLNDFMFIRLKHKDLLERELKSQAHSSELEISLFEGDIGYQFNMEGTWMDPKAKVGRKNPEELDIVLKDMISKIENFKGYTKEQKFALSQLKAELKDDTGFFELINKYLATYKTDEANTENGKNIKKRYCEMRSYYLNAINLILVS